MARPVGAPTAAATGTVTRSADEKPKIKALLIRLKWPESAAEAFVEGQGIDDFDTLRYLTNDTAIALYRTLRKPGGDGDGVTLSLVAEEMLKLLL